MKIEYTDYAKLCMRDIFTFYKNSSRKDYGRKLKANIFAKTKKLKDYPSLGQIEENLQDLRLGHRYLVEGHYKIIYRKSDEIIIVTDIFDTRQNPSKMVG